MNKCVHIPWEMLDFFLIISPWALWVPVLFLSLVQLEESMSSCKGKIEKFQIICQVELVSFYVPRICEYTHTIAGSFVDEIVFQTLRGIEGLPCDRRSRVDRESVVRH